ncbi:Hypothetical protein SRAE_0000043500 [Strongyloides ratti]|uniref:Uncharacterized protein n=1 Tax=Strongyloides ratti TaxID=34506 RepID=A0A090L1H0_STRRB|nr:Hypothetical protein SRAE_0000043500 [Strongyloides ratti]CEF61309.1 Hypothetical protein SRAE_0000043500 [Strongyloides ratti]
MLFYNIVRRTIFNDFSILKQSPLLFNSIINRKCHNNLSKSPEQKPPDTNNKPTVKQLVEIDWITQNMVPNFFKGSLGEFFYHCVDDVSFNDKIYNYNFVGKDNLLIHITKVRSYFRYKSPFNRCDYKGSIIYDNDNFLTILWQISTYNSNWKMYIPHFTAKMKPEERLLEGALELNVTDIDKKEAERLSLLKKKQFTEEEEGEKK